MTTQHVPADQLTPEMIEAMSEHGQAFDPGDVDPNDPALEAILEGLDDSEPEDAEVAEPEGDQTLPGSDDDDDDGDGDDGIDPDFLVKLEEVGATPTEVATLMKMDPEARAQAVEMLAARSGKQRQTLGGGLSPQDRERVISNLMQPVPKTTLSAFAAKTGLDEGAVAELASAIQEASAKPLAESVVNLASALMQQNAALEEYKRMASKQQKQGGDKTSKTGKTGKASAAPADKPAAQRRTAAQSLQGSPAPTLRKAVVATRLGVQKGQIPLAQALDLAYDVLKARGKVK